MADLSEFLRKHGVRYKWIGTWPAIPVKPNPAEPTPRREPQILEQQVWSGGICKKTLIQIPPDLPPEWVERIYERIFQQVLKFKTIWSIEFLDAAIYGFLYAASRVKRVGKLYDDLPPTKDVEHALRRREHQEQSEQDERKSQESILAMCQRRLAEVQSHWQVGEVAEYMLGYAHGIKCQLEEESQPRSARVEKMQILKALAFYHERVQSLIQKGATGPQIAEDIARYAIRPGGETYSHFFDKFPPKCEGEGVKLPSGDLVSTYTKEGRQRAKRLSAKGKYLKLFEKVCADIRLPLPPRGRPRRNSPDN